MEETDVVDIDYYGDVIAETDDAWFLDTENGNVWFPKSACEIDKNLGIVIMPEWLAIKEGLV